MDPQELRHTVSTKPPNHGIDERVQESRRAECWLRLLQDERVLSFVPFWFREPRLRVFVSQKGGGCAQKSKFAFDRLRARERISRLFRNSWKTVNSFSFKWVYSLRSTALCEPTYLAFQNWNNKHNNPFCSTMLIDDSSVLGMEKVHGPR